MSSFFHFARQMLRYPLALTAAVLCAVIAAAGLGAGLASLVPIMKLMLGDEAGPTSLAELAREHNANDPVLVVPDWLIAALPADPYHGVIVIMVTLAALTVFGATANFLHQYLSITVATRTITRIRQHAFRHVVFLPLSRVVERGPSEFVARIVRDASELQRGFISLTSKSVAQVTRGLAAFTVAVWVRWEIAVAAPFIGLALGVILKKLGKRIRRGKKYSLHAQQRLLRIATESVQGLRAVKASTGERNVVRRFLDENRQVYRQEMRARTARAISGPLVETLAIFVIGGLVIILAKQIIHGSLTFPEFAVALAALAAAGASFKPLTAVINELQAASAPAGRLMELLDEEREVVQRGRRRALSRHRRSILYDGVCFTYPGATRPALDDVSLRVAHGERIAIVGPNGCGKTTLLSMLPRLLRPTEGRVLIDGVDIESINLRSLRRQVGVVTQETVLFRGSIADNIAFGCDGARRKQVIDAAKQAHAHGFIEQLPGGYDADVLEQGASLSGGQRQRLAIARAILRNPAILILDEATSQIDADSERHINEAIAEFCADRTALIIAHRLSTVLHADRIVVMDAGRIVDVGPHDDLLSRCDLYERLYRTQLIG